MGMDSPSHVIFPSGAIFPVLLRMTSGELSSRSMGLAEVPASLSMEPSKDRKSLLQREESVDNINFIG